MSLAIPLLGILVVLCGMGLYRWSVVTLRWPWTPTPRQFPRWCAWILRRNGWRIGDQGYYWIDYVARKEDKEAFITCRPDALHVNQALLENMAKVLADKHWPVIVSHLNLTDAIRKNCAVHGVTLLGPEGLSGLDHARSELGHVATAPAGASEAPPGSAWHLLAGTAEAAEGPAPPSEWAAGLETVDVRAFGARGDGIADDAAAIRAAIGSGRWIVVPPGTYHFKSRVTPPRPVTNQNTPCILFEGVRDCYVSAYGARFVIDDAISGPNAAYEDCGASHIGFANDCHNAGWFGGTLVGNRRGLAPATANNGLWFSSVTKLRVQDLTIEGDFGGAGSAITGVFGFDSIFENVAITGATFGFDVSHLENVVIAGLRCVAGAGEGNCAVSLFYDRTTLGCNVTTAQGGTRRELTAGMSGSVRIESFEIAGFHTGILVDGVREIRLSDGHVHGGRLDRQGGAGITINNGASGAERGHMTGQVTIERCRIEECGNATGLGAGGGVVLSTNGFPLDGIAVVDCRIRRNRDFGIGGASLRGLGHLIVTGNDFGGAAERAVQKAAIDPAILAMASPSSVVMETQ